MMYAERNMAGQAIADSRAEISRAIANVKRCAEDKWFRRMWYKAGRRRSVLLWPTKTRPQETCVLVRLGSMSLRPVGTRFVEVGSSRLWRSMTLSGQSASYCSAQQRWFETVATGAYGDGGPWYIPARTSSSSAISGGQFHRMGVSPAMPRVTCNTVPPT